MEKTTLGLIVGSREGWPKDPALNSRKKVINVLEDLGFKAIFPEHPKLLISRKDAKKWGDLFEEKSEEIDGIVVTLPNFGEGVNIAEAIRISKLEVPILVHALPDDKEKMDIENRRDSFCGKFFLCNTLKQYGIKFTLTSSHTETYESKKFVKDLEEFGKICKITNVLINSRIGLIGARPGPFKPVRFSEKVLERRGISVETMQLAEVIGKARKISSEQIKREVEKIKNYIPSNKVPDESIEKMAKLLKVISKWSKKQELDGTAISCWPALQDFYGIVPCAVMSILTNELSPSACEADVAGALSMLALQNASEKPAMLLDLNNNYGNDKFVIWHCSAVPKSAFESARMSYNKMQERRVGIESSWGTCEGKIKAGPATFFRISFQREEELTCYIAEGKISDEKIDTFGAYGITEISGAQEFLRKIASEGFEHHVAVTYGHHAKALKEAIKYLGWEVIRN